MGVTTQKEIKIDFYDSRYIAVNVKQYDEGSRHIIVSCCNHGKFVKLNQTTHVVYMRLKRPDGKGIFRKCTITHDGKIDVCLVGKALEFSGRCNVDLVVYDKLYGYGSGNNDYDGWFVVEVIDDNNGNIELIHYPPANVEYDDAGNVSIKTIQQNDETVTIPDNPYPYVKEDDGNVVFASVSPTGQIFVPGSNILTTMSFYVNVVSSVFSDGVELI